MSRRRTPTALAVLALLLTLLAVVSPTAEARNGSCGLRHRTGVTAKAIRIGSIVDRTGPEPGLYLAARQAVRAYVAYFNAHHRICGRRLVLDRYDARTDAAGDRAATRAACRRDFATVGSMTTFDNGGAALAQRCRLPDVRAAASTAARNACRTCFGVDATRAGEVANSVPDFFVAQHPAAVAKAALLWLNVPSSASRAATLLQAEQARGFTFTYTAAIDVADFSYGPYVAQLASHDVRLVQVVGTPQTAARLALAMKAAGYAPEVYLADPDAYDPTYVHAAGSAGEGTVVPVDFTPLDAQQSQLALYRHWLAKVAPGAVPTPAGLYAWSAAKLFTTQARALGRRLTRARLVAWLRTVRGWTGGGLHAPQAVGTKHTAACTRLLQLHAGHWVPVGGTAYRCSGLTTVE